MYQSEQNFKIATSAAMTAREVGNVKIQRL